MAVTGRFEADFQTFYDAVQKAEVSLRGFDAGANQVERSINKMVDSFTGRRVISEATLMAEAVTRIGSPARLTSAELQRMGGVAQEAVEKLTRVGEEVPPKIQQLADAARRARGETDNLRGSFQQFDGVLAAMGLNLGPQIRGIEDIASASGKSAVQLGTLATAGLAVGAGVAGWGVGRAISGFFDLDKTIGDATAKLLGWGDVAAQEAGAGADALAKASKTAGFAVTTMSTALAVNSAALADLAAKAKDANDAITRMNAPFRSAEQLAKWRGELDTLKKAGLIESLRDDIKSQAFSVAELAANYAVSVGAIQAFNREEQNTIDVVHRRNAQFLKDTAEQLERAQAKRKAAEAHRKALDEEAAAAVEATNKAHELGIAFDEAQRLAKDRTDQTTAALKREKDAADGAARSMGNTIEYDLSTKEGMAQFRRLNPGASVNTPEGYFQTHTLADAVRDGLVNFYARYTAAGAGGSERAGPLPAPLVTGALGSRGATLVGPSDIVVTVNVSGVMDPASVRMLTKVMSDEMLTRVKMGRQFGTA